MVDFCLARLPDSDGTLPMPTKTPRFRGNYGFRSLYNVSYVAYMNQNPSWWPETQIRHSSTSAPHPFHSISTLSPYFLHTVSFADGIRNGVGDGLVFAYRCIIFTDAVQSLSGGVFSGANLDRLGSIPSTSRILLISEKFCEARAFSFGTSHKTKSKFYRNSLVKAPLVASLLIAQEKDSKRYAVDDWKFIDTTADLTRQDF